MPVTGDYLVVRLSFLPVIMSYFFVWIYTYCMYDSTVIYRSWRVFCHQRHFNWGLAWKIPVLLNTPKPHTRWIQMYVENALADLSTKYERPGSCQRTSCMVEEWKTNLMSLAILFHFLCAQHVSDINISIFRSLRLCCWITNVAAGFWVVFVLQAEVVLQTAKRTPPKTSRTKSPTHNELSSRRPMW